MPDPDANAVNDESDALVEKIRPLLAWKDPMLQSIVLADLLAIWLSGHQAVRKGDKAILGRYRERLLADHLGLVLSLVAAYDQVRAEATN